MKNLRPVRLSAAVLLLLMVIGLVVAGGLVFGADQAWSAQTARMQPSRTYPSIAVTLAKAAQKRARIVTGTLGHVFYTKKIQAYGMVLSLQGLANLARSYARARAQVENAKTKLQVSQLEYARQKALYAHNQSSSLKELQLAESVRNQNLVNLETALMEQRILVGTALQQWGEVISNWVFNNAPSYSKLIDREEMLVQVSLPAGEKISPMPRETTIKPAGQVRLIARFVSPSPRTDPKIQGLSYFYMVSSRIGQLEVGMNVAVFLPAGPTIGGFLVPSSAVVWQNGQPLVFVQTGAEHFTARPIATNIPVPGGYLVTSGFSAAERVVVDGAQVLLSVALLAGQGA